MTTKIKLTEETLEILNNFAVIQPNILIKPGSQISTISTAKNVMGHAVLGQEFPAQMAIYDLPEFLRVVNLIEEPELVFQDEGNDYVTVRNSTGTSQAVYYFSSEKLLIYPNKKIPPQDVDVEYQISAAMMKKIREAASVFNYEMVALSNGKIMVCTEKQVKGNSTDNFFEADLPTTVHANDLSTISGVIAIKNMNFVIDDYTVEVSRAKLATFKAKTKGVEYFVAMHNDSKFEG